ncbi:transcriptional regulator, AlpA family [Haloechinothrix alba]|uniref:Transcriptional regulator, AlpA family n=1 Tax=Haloechinothrix alba TaxID=664784 RepID=A0A238WMU8_9PSEU|nr:helix-turn-helix domain-containing protein [Haloechinothrix alba]SNR47865.1 transcriptional regulator, AlpA family [Haloechinothrix alba]
MTDTTVKRELVTVPEMAHRLGIGRSLGYELINKGEIASVKIGKSRRVPCSEIDRYIAEHTQHGAA